MGKKVVVLVSLIVMVPCLFTGCGRGSKLSADTIEKNTILIRSDGSMEQFIVEKFRKNYYTEEGLKEFADKEISEYNKEADKEAISLSHITVKKKQARLMLSYHSFKDFNQFNMMDCRLLTVAEARDEGILPDTLSKAEGDEKVSLSDAQLEDTWSVFLFCGNSDIQTGGELQYYSGAILLGQSTVEANDGETTVVIFKQ